MRPNPYTPGAGFMPAYLAGRETLIENAEEYLRSIKARYPQQSVVYYGLRGVGKTVLLNQIEMSADNLGILYTHIEAVERTRSAQEGYFTNKLVSAIDKFLSEISVTEKVRELFQRCVSSLKAFSLSYNIESTTIGLEVSKTDVAIKKDYAYDLTELMVQLGKYALNADHTICFFIDEVQYLSEQELGGLIAAIHRCNQLRLPILVFCAGLPKILKTAGTSYSYAERLFRFEPVDALNATDAAAAIQEPAKDFAITYESDAVKEIIEITGGYPYFIQEFCSVIWKRTDNQNVITKGDVEGAREAFFKVLDESFFAVRYERCTHLEQSFMTAMVKCGELPCTISNVAKIMGREAKSISPFRSHLISKGMIYPTAHGKIDFTVPQFDSFIKRRNPQLIL